VLDTAFTILIELLFALVFVAVLAEYVRRRDPLVSCRPISRRHSTSDATPFWPSPTVLLSSSRRSANWLGCRAPE